MWPLTFVFAYGTISSFAVFVSLLFVMMLLFLWLLDSSRCLLGRCVVKPWIQRRCIIAHIRRGQKHAQNNGPDTSEETGRDPKPHFESVRAIRIDFVAATDPKVAGGTNEERNTGKDSPFPVLVRPHRSSFQCENGQSGGSNRGSTRIDKQKSRCQNQQQLGLISTRFVESRLLLRINGSRRGKRGRSAGGWRNPRLVV